MAEVVVGLETILALQEKTNNALHPPSMTIFGRKMPMLLFQSNGENQVGGRHLKSLESYFDSDGGESRKVYQFDFLTISIATENFSEANKIWQGQYDSMYKGMLQNGHGIAIKKAYFSSEFSRQKYIHNVVLLANLEHENLAQLLGYCLEGTTIFLVYEFALYASLDHFIFDPRMRTLLDWNKRYEIILGVANALIYLHKHAPTEIVHTDVRPQNIIFDKSMDHKLSYLGLATRSTSNEIDCINVDKLNGIMGYIAPEYMIEGRLSTKVDVFGFGLLVLEIISGKRNYLQFAMANGNFVQYAWTNWLAGTSSHITDPTIDADSSLISRFIHIGLLCVQADPTDRPTMDAVIGMLLNSSSHTLPLPKNPVSSWIIEETSYYTNAESDDYDAGAVEEFKSELIPR